MQAPAVLAIHGGAGPPPAGEPDGGAARWPGQAEALAAALRAGLAEEVEALGASLDSGARWDASRVNLNAMSSKLAPAMEIFADVVRNPTFKADEIERLRQALQAVADTPDPMRGGCHCRWSQGVARQALDALVKHKSS